MGSRFLEHFGGALAQAVEFIAFSLAANDWLRISVGNYGGFGGNLRRMKSLCFPEK